MPEQKETPFTQRSNRMSRAKEARAATKEQEGDTNLETALAALSRDNDTDLEETDVQDTLLAYTESRQLRRTAYQWWELRVDSTSRS